MKRFLVFGIVIVAAIAVLLFALKRPPVKPQQTREAAPVAASTPVSQVSATPTPEPATPPPPAPAPVADKPEKQLGAVVRVGCSPVMSSAGLYLAMDQGYFEEQNIRVEMVDVPASGAAMTLLLAKGQMDVAAGNLTSGLFNAIGKKKSIKLVADKGHLAKGRSYIGLLVRKDHIQSGRFKSLSDLKGFKMALTSLDGVSQQILGERFLEKGGLKEKNITYVKMSYAEMNVALKNKLIDAAVQLEPYLTKAKLEGIAENVAEGADYYSDQQSAAIMYSSRFINQNREVGVRFMTAYLKGVRLYNQGQRDPKVRKIVQDILKKSIQIEDQRVWDQMVPVGLSDSGQMNTATLMEDLRWYRQKNYIAQDLQEEDLIDPAFAREASARLAKVKP